jgi:hypothetical protein
VADFLPEREVAVSDPQQPSDVVAGVLPGAG